MNPDQVATEDTLTTGFSIWSIVGGMLSIAISFFWLWVLILMVLFIVDTVRGKGLKCSGWWITVLKWMFNQIARIARRKEGQQEEKPVDNIVPLEPTNN